LGLIFLFAAGVVVFAFYDMFRGLSDVGKQGDEVSVSTVDLRSINYPYAEISTNGWGYTTEIKLYVPQDTIQTEYDFGIVD
jgi:hypothetical protein